MGGRGSGGGRLSDEEKKAKGTFKPSRSDAVYDARAAAKVITGPWLTAIPEPSLPLNEAGRAKYDELANLLFQGNKLTKVTCMDCEVVALHWQNVQAKVAAGLPPSTDTLKQIASITARLKIAEEAAPIANPAQRNKFASIGTANNVVSTFRLRPPAKTGTGEL